MKREELQHDFYNERGIGWINSQGEPDIDYVMWLEDKILATKNVSLPPAEGAEAITRDLDELIKKHVPISAANFEFCVKHNLINGGLLQGIRDVATLHAHKIADKMVEDMRKKLFSMRASKETMDMLSEADRLITYGYHDCINEMLMWTKKAERNDKRSNNVCNVLR